MSFFQVLSPCSLLSMGNFFFFVPLKTWHRIIHPLKFKMVECKSRKRERRKQKKEEREGKIRRKKTRKGGNLKRNLNIDDKFW